MDHKAVTGQLAKILGRDSKDITALIDGLATTMRDNLCDMNTVECRGLANLFLKKKMSIYKTTCLPGNKYSFHRR